MATVMQRIVKPKTQAAKRGLEVRAPKLEENDKVAMFIKGGHTSETITQVLKELYLLKKPNAITFKRKNIMRPFDDQSSIEFFSQKNDSSLFLFGSHSKKRPNNLVLGRLYDHHVLDMVELGVTHFRSMQDFPTEKIAMGTKPCLVFEGEAFEQDHEHRRLKNMLIDFFRGVKANNVRLQGLEHVLQFTALDGKVMVRSYKVLLKKSGSRTPRVELSEIGPALDLEVRRTRLASDDLYKKACKKPKKGKPKKVKNVKTDVFGAKMGRVHMERQDFSKLQTRKMKGLKRQAPSDKENAKKAKTESSEPSAQET
ncbi:ribosome production factor 2 homolog [Branchiostoma floridae x Branchiostoma japonicum]